MALIKKLFKRILQFKIYRRIIASFCLMFIATVAVLSCLLFFLFSASTAREIDNTSKQMLAQTSYAADLIYEQVLTISSYLINDNNVVSFFHSENIDKVVYYNISRQLTNIQNVYSFIRSIGLYNLDNGRKFDTLDIPIDEAVLISSRVKHIEIYPRKAVTRYYDYVKEYDLVTFIIFPEYSMSKTSSSVIVINIDQNYIINTVSSIGGVSFEPSTFVMDSEGLIVSHSDPLLFMHDISGQNYVQSILDDENQAGSLVTNIDNEKHLVTYIKSDKFDWSFVSVKQYNKLVANIHELQKTIIIVSVIIVIVGIIVSFMLTSAIYNPIKSLMEKVGSINAGRVDEYQYLLDAFIKSRESSEMLSTSIKKASCLIKENYIYNLLKGGSGRFNLLQEVFSNIGNHLSSRYYCLFIFKIDDIKNIKLYKTEKEVSLLRFIVSNISQELLLRHFKNDSCSVEEDEVAVLALMNDDSLPDEVFLTLAEIQDAIRKHFNFTVSIYIGDVLESIRELSKSYKTLKEYGRYRLFLGYESIIDHRKYATQAEKTSFYPLDTERKLISALHLCDNKLINKSITSFINHISEVNYYEAVNYSNHLVTAIVKKYSNFINSQDNFFRQYLDLERITSAESMKDISDLITELSVKICDRINEMNSNMNMQRYCNIVENVKKYIMDNYSDPNLSLDVVADKVELSAGYLGKLFKSITSVSFNDYLNNIRLEKAKELLSTTNEPSSRICEKVGIYNITYFSTLFKKTYGVTPSAFRANSSRV
jgi:two-component system response regulator YesN